MVLAIVVTLIVTAALGCGFRRERGGALIVRHPYNNRYNDVTTTPPPRAGRTSRAEAPTR